MKTLYININNEQIQSNEELEVLNYDLDSDFFFYFGEKIAKGCNVDNENAIITDFKTQDNEEEYKQIVTQWNEIKAILFSEEYEREFEFRLPNGYIHWLRYSEKYNHVYDKYFSHGEPTLIIIDLEELYEDSIEDLQRKILRKLQRDDLYLEIDKIVFNDDAVTRKSPIVRTIKEKYEGIGFKTYKKGEVIENQLPEEKEAKIDSSFLYLIRKEHEVFKVLDKEGRVVEPLETILVVDYRFNAYLQSDMPPYLLGLNTADDKLYFISPKQILCIGDWYNGKLDTSYALGENPQLSKYCICSNLFEKEVILQEDFKTFCIKDKYDYETYYKVENGICMSQIEKPDTEQESNLAYILDEDGEIPVSVSAKTGEKVKIPGFKANIYLGNENEKDIFWATKYCAPGQHRFKESFIVDINGNIIRNYEYNYAWPIEGKYILNISSNLRASSISALNGSVIIKLNFSLDNFTEITEIEPKIFKFKPNIFSHSQDCFWLVKENVLCTQYNKHFYIAPNKNLDDCLYRRSDNYLIGIIQLSNLDGSRLPNNIYYAEFKGNFDNRLFFKSNGDTIYKLKDNEFPCIVNDTDGTSKHIVGGVAENRIIINVDNRYYKILDYKGVEIARVDFDRIANCYHHGKLFYYNFSEVGYYDLSGVKHVINYKIKGIIIEIKVISSEYLLITYDNGNGVIIDVEGKIFIEGALFMVDSPSHRYLTCYDLNYQRRYLYDNNCKMLSYLNSTDSVLILE